MRRECHDEFSVSGVLYQEEYDVHVDVFFFSSLESTWGYFYVFANTLLQLCLSSLAYGFRLHPDLLYIVMFTYVRYCFFVSLCYA